MKQCPHCQSMRTAQIVYHYNYDEYGAVEAVPLGDLSDVDKRRLNSCTVSFTAPYCLDCKRSWDVQTDISFYDEH